VRRQRSVPPRPLGPGIPGARRAAHGSGRTLSFERHWMPFCSRSSTSRPRSPARLESSRRRSHRPVHHHWRDPGLGHPSGSSTTATGRTRLPAVMRSSTAVRPAMSAWRTVTSSKEAGQSGRHQPAGGSAFGPHPNLGCVLWPTDACPDAGINQRFRWSEPMWSPPAESNRRHHPYHGCALPTELGGQAVPS
jgi:hypothetical protein